MSIRTFFLLQFSHLPIRYKLIVLMMAVSTVSIALVTLASIVSGIFYITKNQETELRVLASMVGDKNAAALAFDDKSLVAANLEVLATRKSIVSACIYDAKGKPYAVYPDTALCPPVAEDSLAKRGGGLEIFYTVKKRGEALGVVFLRSSMAEVAAYTRQQVVTAAAVFAGALVCSYLLALLLQKAVSRPIMALAAETKTAWEKGTVNVGIHQAYEDELGQIARSFNKILAEREQKHQEFFKKHQEFSTVLEHSQKTLAMLDEEASFPFKAAFTYKKMLEMQAFGPIHQSYADYFNDVYGAEVELYQVLVTALDTFRLHQELFNATPEPLFVAPVLHRVLKERLAREVLPRVTFSVKAQSCVGHTCYRKPFERMVGMLLSLCLESRKLGYFYRCDVTVEAGAKAGVLVVEFAETSVANQHGNDNFKEVTLEKLIQSVKYREPVWLADMPLCIDFEDASIRHFLYSTYFLSDINQCPVSVRLAAHKVAFVVAIPAIPAGERKTQEILLTNARGAAIREPIH